MLGLLEGFSVEMTGKDVSALRQARGVLPAGSRVNVTFLGNEDMEMRVAAAAAVVESGMVPVPHVSARRLESPGRLAEFLSRLQGAGASRSVFCVGGDSSTPAGPYGSALDVIRSGALEAHGVREVSVAGYPEGHPDIPADVLWRALGDKLAALRDLGLEAVVLTQFAFDAGAVVAWIQQARERGISSPIRVGTPGPAGVGRLLRYASRMGVGANAMVVRKYGFSLANLAGSAGPGRFLGDLAAGVEDVGGLGKVGLHFYTFGGLKATADWVAAYTSASREKAS